MVIALVLIPELLVVVGPRGRRRHVIVRAAALLSCLFAAQRDWEAERRSRRPSLVAQEKPLAGPSARPLQMFRRPWRHHVRDQPAQELRWIARTIRRHVADRRERERLGVLKSVLCCERSSSWRP